MDRWNTGDPPKMERLLVIVSYKDDYPNRTKMHIAWYDTDRKEWRWEGGKINGTVTHWQRLPDYPN